jgi:hypothetical protein
MLYQVIGKNDVRQGNFDKEVLLGCIRIDSANFVRTVECSKFAFNVFRSHEDNSYDGTHCSVRDKFLVVSGDYPHLPEPQGTNRDVLFFYQEKNEQRQKVWKFLQPSHNGNAMTGVVVWGGEALTRLMVTIKSNAR